MARSNALAHLGAALARPGFSQALADQVEALPQAAELAAAHEVDGLALEAFSPSREGALLSFPQHGADDLRLPRPPGVRFVTGVALVNAAREAIDAYDASATQAVGAHPDALAAEARMIALVRGIQELQQHIEAQRDANHAA